MEPRASVKYTYYQPLGLDKPTGIKQRLDFKNCRGTPGFTLLHFTNVVFFYKLKVCGSPAWSRSISTSFPTVSAHLSVSILEVLTIFQILSLLPVTSG